MVWSLSLESVNCSSGKYLSLEELSLKTGTEQIPSAVIAMENLKPRTLEGVRRLMCLLGVYRRRTKNFVHN